MDRATSARWRGATFIRLGRAPNPLTPPPPVTIHVLPEAKRAPTPRQRGAATLGSASRGGARRPSEPARPADAEVLAHGPAGPAHTRAPPHPPARSVRRSPRR